RKTHPHSTWRYPLWRFFELTSTLYKINLHKIQNVILRSKNKYTYCIASNEYVLYIQLIQTTPATPG
ncbi:hypothetical protein OFN40_32160, partial [Escherichia coli]|nr:hypothetical protein [Escherichia coli]